MHSAILVLKIKIDKNSLFHCQNMAQTTQPFTNVQCAKQVVKKKLLSIVYPGCKTKLFNLRIAMRNDLPRSAIKAILNFNSNAKK